ncbi:MAG: hypothetical protein KF752_00725 [Pirellulaceae bacterium]|nr:hypothetical protein [Pirellulaceae bacterium]
MALTTIEFCQNLAEQIPDIRAIMTEHVSDNDGLLPHVFMGEVTRYVLIDGPSRPIVVAALENAFDRHGKEIEELIAVSFVENLETQQDLEIAFRGIDAPRLTAEWRRQKTG